LHSDAARPTVFSKEEYMNKGKQQKAPTERAVMVTTAHRGVFFGYATDTDGETIALKRARLCLYWSADVKGFMGLAASGPDKRSRIGAQVDQIALRKVTAVAELTPAAVAAWTEAEVYRG
jgi:hypothetical protein